MWPVFLNVHTTIDIRGILQLYVCMVSRCVLVFALCVGTVGVFAIVVVSVAYCRVCVYCRTMCGWVQRWRVWL